MLTHEEAIATINGVRDEVGYPGIDFNKLIRNYFRLRGLPAPDELTSSAVKIAAERSRQINKEGWDEEHDAQYTEGELIRASICYSRAVLFGSEAPEEAIIAGWPWEYEWWKPTYSDTALSGRRAYTCSG
jgi:hypothetical protein